jgi:transposase
MISYLLNANWYQVRHQSALLDKLTHENALLKRMKFAAQSERFNPEQKSLLEDEIEADLAAVATEIEALQPPQPSESEGEKQPKRLPLPTHLPRREIHHEPESTTCQCGCQMKRIGEDVAEKLDYVPGVFSVERHIRGKWVCAQCETITLAPVEAHVIDKGIPTTGLLAQVLVAKFADHLPPVPSRGHLRQSRLGHSSIHPGAVGRHLRGPPAAAGRRPEDSDPRTPCAARR